MASTPTAFKQRLIPILSSFFDITDPETLDKAAEALSNAIHDYVTQDVEVAPGQPVRVTTPQGPGTGTTIGPGKLI
tara:strand:+ start:1050 stop:1277 length:228 start_codon:yes stop_codon:yes gene_type:complete